MYKYIKLNTRLLIRGFHILIVLLLLLGPVNTRKVIAADDAGFALSFDGENDYVALGHTADIIGANWKTTKSISVWIRPTGNGQACYDNDVANCDAIIVDQPHFFGISRGIVGGQDKIWVWNYDGTTTKIGVPYEIDQWVHITMVHTNGFLKMFRNGNLIGQVVSNATLLGPDVPFTKLQLGAFLNPPRLAAYQGLIDEVRIYSIELTEQMITDTLRTHLVGNESGLQAYYKMSDGSGVTLTDDSVNSFNGTLFDGTPYVASNGSGPLWVNSSAFDFPVADDQLVTVQEDDTNFPITLTGSSPNGTNLTFIVTSTPLHGTLTGAAPDLTYTPFTNYNGSDQFSFYINDQKYDSSEAIVTITVEPVNDAPSAYPQSLTTDEDINLPITLTGSDVDTGDLLTYEIVNDPTMGDLTGVGDEWTYEPGLNFYGDDSFTYRVFDGTVYSSPATISIHVNPINDVPVAYGQSLSTDEDTNLSITLTGQDVDGENISFRVVNQPDFGILIGSGANRTYQPNPDYNGSDFFTFVVNDGHGDSSPATISITIDPVNDAPVAILDNYQVTMNEELVVNAPGVLTNDSDVDGDSISTDLVSNVTHGNLVLSSNGSFTYTPVSSYIGLDSFEYRVYDGFVYSNSVVVTIEVLETSYYIYLPLILR
jgi:hypothetical protein